MRPASSTWAANRKDRLPASMRESGLQRWRIVAYAVALQLLAALAVYQLHDRLDHPPPHPAGAPAGATWQTSTSDPGSAAAAAAAAAGRRAGPGCTVTLAEADAQTLRQQVAAMVHSLAGVVAVPDSVERSAANVSLKGGEQLGQVDPGVFQLVDEPFGPSPGSNIPGVEDVHRELSEYTDHMVEGMTSSAEAASKRQLRVTATQLGLTPVDPLEDLASIPARVAFLNDLAAEVQARESVRVAITTTTAADLAGVRREVLPWLQYHTELGVTKFYLLYDGSSSEAVEALGRVRHVELMHLHSPWAPPADLALYEAYRNLTRQWAGQPGNYELMFKQGYGEQEALRRAGVAKLDWLMHLDPDEFFLPGGPIGRITGVLARQPPHIPAVRFMNFEGQPEAGGLHNRYEQVTLFRVHKHYITPEAHHYRSRFKLGDNAAFLYLYANGKSAVRVNAPGVRHMGPHFFGGDDSPRWQSPDNLEGSWVNSVSDDSVVLHYAYAGVEDVSAKAHRSCPDEYLAAAKAGNRALIKQRCFVIDIDADAYMAAARGPEAAADFFYSRNVLSEGARVKCISSSGKAGWCSLHSVERLKFLLEKVGLLRRILMPQTLLRQQERAIQQYIRLGVQLQAGSVLE